MAKHKAHANNTDPTTKANTKYNTITSAANKTKRHDMTNTNTKTKD